MSELQKMCKICNGHGCGSPVFSPDDPPVCADCDGSGFESGWAGRAIEAEARALDAEAKNIALKAVLFIVGAEVECFAEAMDGCPMGGPAAKVAFHNLRKTISSGPNPLAVVDGQLCFDMDEKPCVGADLPGDAEDYPDEFTVIVMAKGASHE